MSSVNIGGTACEWKNAEEYYDAERRARMAAFVTQLLNLRKGDWQTLDELAKHVMDVLCPVFLVKVGGHFDFASENGVFYGAAYYILQRFPDDPAGVELFFEVPNPYLKDGSANPEFGKILMDKIPLYLSIHKKLYGKTD